MFKVIYVILKYYSSIFEESKYDDCFIGFNFWCSYQYDQVNGINLYKLIKNLFFDVVVEVMQLFFDRLGNDIFFVGCESCYI